MKRLERSLAPPPMARQLGPVLAAGQPQPRELDLAWELAVQRLAVLPLAVPPPGLGARRTSEARLQPGLGAQPASVEPPELGLWLVLRGRQVRRPREAVRHPLAGQQREQHRPPH